MKKIVLFLLLSLVYCHLMGEEPFSFGEGRAIEINLNNYTAKPSQGFCSRTKSDLIGLTGCFKMLCWHPRVAGTAYGITQNSAQGTYPVIGAVKQLIFIGIGGIEEKYHIVLNQDYGSLMLNTLTKTFMVKVESPLFQTAL